MTTTVLVVGVVIVAASAVEPAVAAVQQGQDAAIVGRVLDSSGAAVPNAIVSVASRALIGGPRSVATNSSGAYRLAALTPGDYEAAAAAGGFTTRRATLLLLAGATVTADFVLPPAGVEESVRVSAKAPIVDVRTSGSSTVIQRDVLENLPLSRQVSSYVNLAPGVVKDVAFGSSVRSNPFYLDGASGNEPGWGTPTVAPSASWVDELQVVSLGADAQFGEYTGALTNAITRSGSDRFGGVVDYWTTRQSWVADNRSTLPPAIAAGFTPLDILERRSFVAQAGGPVMKQRAWFFVGLDQYRNSTTPAGFAGVGAAAQNAVDALSEPKWLAKITAAPAQPLRLEAFVARDHSTETGANASPTTMPEALAVNRRPETLWNMRAGWTASDRLLVEARVGGSATNDIFGPADESAIAGPPAHIDTVTGVVSGNVSNYSKSFTRPVSASMTVTRSAGGAYGRPHDVKGGFDFEADRLRQESGFPGGMLYYDANGQPTEVFVKPATQYRPDHRRETLFVQDAWAASPRVTVNAGLRVGFYQGAITGFPTQFSDHSVSPRAGVAWDARGDHSLAVRGHFGRYHEEMVTSFYDFLDPLSQQTLIDATVVAPGQFSEVYRVQPSGAYRIDPNIAYPYADEWIAGADYAVARRVTLTAQYIGRRYGSIVGFVGPMNGWTPTQVRDPGPDGVLGTGDDGALMTIYLNPGTTPSTLTLTNPPGAYKHYEGLQFVATRRGGSRWQGTASYTYSRTRASFDNAFSSNAANNDLSLNGVYVNPNRALFSTGRVAADYTHEAKVFGTLEVPRVRGLAVSGVYRYQSGYAWARVVRFPGATQLYTEAVEPRGAHEAPATNAADLRVEQSFRAGAARIGAYLDVFNIGNQGIALRYQNLSGPMFGIPVSWSDPRTLRLGARVRF